VTASSHKAASAPIDKREVIHDPPKRFLLSRPAEKPPPTLVDKGLARDERLTQKKGPASRLPEMPALY
jgi:hypothetical protein